MKVFCLFILSAFYFGITNVASAQDSIPFYEGFENGGGIPAGWTIEYKTLTAPWDFINGGAIPPGDSQGLPPSAYAGSYNARFYKSSFSVHETYLVSPPIEYKFALKPQLSFWYAQMQDQLPDADPDNTKFKIYYRTPEEGNVWYLLKEVLDPTDVTGEANNGWVYDSLPLPDSLSVNNYETIQLGFLGISTTVGYGSCIDEINLINTDTLTKQIENIWVAQPDDMLDIIPTGSNNNAILQIRFPVEGNDGFIKLDSIAVTAMENSDLVVPTNGVKLFHTKNDLFSSEKQIGTAKSFVGGKAVFTNLNYELPFGNSYLWVTYDVPVDTDHEFKNYALDAKIEAYDVRIKIITNEGKISYSNYPFFDKDPEGHRDINESVFFDDFETVRPWTLTGEFERDSAYGLGGFYQNPDPDYAKSGVKVLGTDLTGNAIINGVINNKKGDYEPGILEADAYKAITQTFDCTYYRDLNLQYYRWLNVNFGDTATIDYSIDGGTTWENIYTNTSLVAENEWKFVDKALGNKLDRTGSVTIRYTLGPTGVSQYLSGWNIDNFALTGNFVNKDAGISALVTPETGCGHVVPEDLTVTIGNYGFDVLSVPIPVEYSVNNWATKVSDTLKVSIPKGGTIDFTFSQKIDLTSPGNHTLSVRTALPGDEDTRNNLLDTAIYVYPTYTLPYSENFETNDGYWRVGGINETWEHGEPAGVVIKKAASGYNCWATNLDGNYPNNDYAWLESPCFNFTGIDKPILDFMLFTKAEKNNDGLAIYYSIDEGLNWVFVPKELTNTWNWYNNTSISALGHAGWDSVKNVWFKARQVLPAATANQPVVKFRFIFKSNATINSEGFALDDIRLYNAPTDAGISAIVSPKNSCSLSKTQSIKVAVKNYGIRPITALDTIFAKVIVNTTKTLTDTFIVSTPIAVNDTMHFTFKRTANMYTKKWHKMKASTQVKGDTAYYVAGVYNDTFLDSAYVKGEPFYTLGPDIGTYNSDTVLLDGKVQSVGGANFLEYLWEYEYDLSTATTKTYDVPAYPGGETSIKFNIRVKNDSLCFIYDTIEIIETQVDVGIQSISGIADKCIDAQGQALSVTIKNHSTVYDIPGNSYISVGYKLGESENEDPYIETFQLGAGGLLREATLVHAFTQQPVYEVSGSKTLSIFTAESPDLNYANDTLYQPVEIFLAPYVELGADSILTAQADTLLFDAGSDPISYLWQDNSTAQTFDVTSNLSATYAVTVTSGFSCGTASDQVKVISDSWALGNLVAPITQCSTITAAQVKVQLINNSTNTYPKDFSIPAKIDFNGTVYNETILLPAILGPSTTIEYTFSPTFNMSTPKEYSIKVEINPAHDLIRTDNKISKKVNIWGIKKVNIGPDTIITKKADTILLDAGNKFASYFWQDGSSASTYQIGVQNTYKYWVSVTDFNGCPASSDTLRIIADDMIIEELTSPESKCDPSAINTISFTIRNGGYDDIKQGEVVKFYYSVDNLATKMQSYQIPFDIAPGQIKKVVLDEDFAFMNDQTYNFKIYSDWSKDFFNTNDTLITVIQQLEHPVVNLGSDIYTSKADTVVLRAPSGYTNYRWNDESRQYFLPITNNWSAEYWVEVSNSYGCTDVDTLNIYTYDLSVTAMQSLNACVPSATKKPIVSIKLNSLDTLLAGQQITAKYTFDGTEVSELITLTDSLKSGGSLAYTFTTPFAVVDTGSYSINCSVEMVNEAVTSNNSLVSSFRIGANPVQLGDDIVTYNSSEILDAGASFVSYLWNDASVNQTLTVASSGKYKVTATDAGGCSESDSINVLFMFPAYDITEIVGLADDCAQGSSEIISFKLKNSGNDTVLSGQKIAISYKINGGTTVPEDYTFTSNFLPGNIVTINFATLANLSAKGAYLLAVNAVISGKTAAKDSTVNTWGLPLVSLGDDIDTPNDTALLDAGLGFVSYLWSTTQTSQAITVKTNGDYWVKVTDNKGCVNSDTVNVFFIPASLYISELISPLKGCGEINEQAVIKITNGSPTVVDAGTILKIGYRVGSRSRVNDIVTLGSAVKPNVSFEYKYDNFLTITDAGNVEVKFYVGLETRDMDSSSYTIPVYEKPAFFGGNDTLGVNNFPYELDPEVTSDSYLWNTNDTTATIVINNVGAYWVKIMDENACEFTGDIYVKNVTGIYDAWSQQIKVYPNPGEKDIFVDLPKNIGEVTLQITDLNGKVLLTKEHISDDLKLDISKWPQGNYLMRIFSADKYGVYQIMKK